MRSKNTSLTKTIILCFALLFVTFNIRAEELHSPGLFSPAGINEQAIVQDNTPVIRSRTVRIDFDQLCQLESSASPLGAPAATYPLELNLFADVNLKARIYQVEKTYADGVSFVGFLEGIPGGEVVMVKSDGILSANINTGQHLYQVRYIAGDLHEVREIEHSRFPSELPPVPVYLGESDKQIGSPSDTGNYIDVLVVYTATARTTAGSTTAMTNLITLAITETNTGYSNSAVSQRVRLVHTAEVSYSESGFNWDTTLSRLQGKSDGYMDNVHTLRDTYGADEVALIISQSYDDYCGLGYLMTTLSTSFESHAFCVVALDCATGYYSLAHEWGHNMGSTHDRANAGSFAGVYDYSYGYQDPDGDFRTIMAYFNGCPNLCTRVNYWSNPDKTYGGKPMGVVYTDPLAADNHKSLNNTLSTVRNFRQSKTTTSPKISLNRTSFYFGAIRSGTNTGGQTLRINNSGGGTLNWSISDNASWLNESPTSGAGAGVVTLSVNPSGLSAGTYTGTITVSATGASNTPQTVSVTLVVKSSTSDQSPFGEFATPVSGSNVSSSIAVTGWALDDIDVASVKIYNGSTYVGDAVFVEGARSDVASAYSTYPKNYQAGWGYMLLTNFLPGGGNGTYTLYAKVTDSAGHVVTLGSKVIYCNNASAVKPFGAIDTPAQGGSASGTNYTNAGWALTPKPNKIPTNGSTIEVYIDSVKKGTVSYNQYRSDIATLFPGYQNSNGAAGTFKFSTTGFSNGVHSIFWIATDNGGNADGIGSRFFIVQNTGADMDELGVRGQGSGVSRGEPVCSPVFDSYSPDIDFASSDIDLSSFTPNRDKPIMVAHGYREDAAPQTVFPGNNGVTNIVIHELERVVIDFGGAVLPSASLPVGSTLDSGKGIFYWIPGPGFVGKYELVFIDSLENLVKRVNINILPK